MGSKQHFCLFSKRIFGKEERVTLSISSLLLVSFFQLLFLLFSASLFLFSLLFSLFLVFVFLLYRSLSYVRGGSRKDTVGKEEREVLFRCRVGVYWKTEVLFMHILPLLLRDIFSTWHVKVRLFFFLPLGAVGSVLLENLVQVPM